MVAFKNRTIEAFMGIGECDSEEMFLLEFFALCVCIMTHEGTLGIGVPALAVNVMRLILIIVISIFPS